MELSQFVLFVIPKALVLLLLELARILSARQRVASVAMVLFCMKFDSTAIMFLTLTRRCFAHKITLILKHAYELDYGNATELASNFLRLIMKSSKWRSRCGD